MTLEVKRVAEKRTRRFGRPRGQIIENRLPVARLAPSAARCSSRPSCLTFIGEIDRTLFVSPLLPHVYMNEILLKGGLTRSLRSGIVRDGLLTALVLGAAIAANCSARKTQQQATAKVAEAAGAAGGGAAAAGSEAAAEPKGH